MPPEQQVTATYILEDVEVKEVSVVDRGANKRPLLVVKNAKAEEPVTVQSNEQQGDPVVAAQAEKASQTTHLMVSLPEAVRDEVGGMLDSLSKRLGALSEAVKASAPGEGGLTDAFKSEVLGLSTVMRRLIGVEKASAVNSVDKAALAEGKPIDPHAGLAVPVQLSSNIEYVMTPEGPLMKMPPDMMLKVAIRFAHDEMYGAEDCLYCDDVVGCCTRLYNCMKALAPFIPAEGSLPEAVQMALGLMLGKQYAYNQPQSSVPAGVPASQPPANPETSGVAKSSKLQELFAQLGELLGDAAPQQQQPVAKAASIPPELREGLIKMAHQVRALSAENATLRGTRPLGNAGQVEETPFQQSKPVHWPDDLNDLPDLDD